MFICWMSREGELPDTVDKVPLLRKEVARGGRITVTKHFNKASEKAKRRRLRNNATNAEKLLWRHLKGKQLGSLKFRRQYSVDHFVLDFYCPELKLAIEVDGNSHFTTKGIEYDKEREAYISAFGITFVRFLNADIFENVDAVLQVILDKAGELREDHPLTPSQGGELFALTFDLKSSYLYAQGIAYT